MVFVMDVFALELVTGDGLVMNVFVLELVTGHGLVMELHCDCWV